MSSLNSDFGGQEVSSRVFRPKTHHPTYFHLKTHYKHYQILTSKNPYNSPKS